MQIGRRIYYELATGNILQDTGERQGSVIETTVEQDFESYTALVERVPETVGMIQLAFGDLSVEFHTCTSYTVNKDTQEIIFDYTSPDIPPPNVSLEDRVKYIEDVILEMMLG